VCVCDWLTSKAPPQPRSEAERGQLRELLARELDPGVRDAASFALAAHFRVTSSRSDSRHLPQSLPALRVHEWGVFRDAGLALTPAETWLADLPGFVHRSRTSAADLWGQ